MMIDAKGCAGLVLVLAAGAFTIYCVVATVAGWLA